MQSTHLASNLSHSLQR